MTWFILLVGGVVGAALASAISCAVMRRGTGHSWTTGRSICDVCAEVLPWYVLIPIVSYVLSRGRTACCKKIYSGWYLTTELIGFVGGAYVASLLFTDLRAALLGAVLVIYALYAIRLDAEKQLVAVPETWIATIGILGISWPLTIDHAGMGMIVGGGVFLLQYLVTQGRAIGFGDVWIGVLLGAAFGWPMVLIAIGLGYVIGATHALWLIGHGRAKKQMHLPLGAYLMMAAVLFLWLEPWFLRLYT
ncbi:hypothetical protein COV06_01350 [Candidatus Uhrbacteria bacterium CG10_big_fil_rev_8_21_14_0_10_50_16]|uniref:Prepilin peptidase A24 N-terminal domain-containing protein n=1 Tax=Candidatus Uhrbacteria bacterium CG10_big_fil_rev_8_21_14_0_10_50_16 TaxID=1975039 RepID=A0A2H0RNK7_9BACT|nr:MAG: hypothetical protein COV06_01350 [Candidatus Uhrbacteria bacterium CG10_big_fil_rev_8_21_14_0_10_50_16]